MLLARKDHTRELAMKVCLMSCMHKLEEWERELAKSGNVLEPSTCKRINLKLKLDMLSFYRQ